MLPLVTIIAFAKVARACFGKNMNLFREHNRTKICYDIKPLLSDLICLERLQQTFSNSQFQTTDLAGMVNLTEAIVRVVRRIVMADHVMG